MTEQVGARRVTILVSGILGVDMLGYGLVVPFLPGHCEALGFSDTATGALFAMYALALLGASLIMAPLARRFSSRRILVGGLIAQAFATLVFMAATQGTLLFVARAMQGAASATAWIVGPSILAEIYPSDQRGAAMSRVLVGSASGTLAGPPLGGFLYSFGGFSIPFIFLAGVALVVALVAHLILPASTPRDAAPRLPLRDVAAAPGVGVFLVIVILAGGLLAMLDPMVPLLLERRFGSTPLHTGLFFGLLVLCYAIATPYSGKLSDRIGRLRVSLLGLGAACAWLVGLALAPGTAVAVVMLAGIGFSLGFLISPTMPAMADALDRYLAVSRQKSDGAYESVYSVFNVAWGVGMTAGPLFVAALADVTTIETAFLVAASTCFVATLLLRRWSRPVVAIDSGRA